MAHFEEIALIAERISKNLEEEKGRRKIVRGP